MSGLSGAAKRALLGPGGAGSGRGPSTAKVCQINSSPRNCPRRGGGVDGSGPSQAGLLLGGAQGKNPPGSAELRDRPGRADARWGAAPPARIRSSCASELCPRSRAPGKGSLLPAGWSGRAGSVGPHKGGEAGAPRGKGWHIPGRCPGPVPHPPAPAGPDTSAAKRREQLAVASKVLQNNPRHVCGAGEKAAKRSAAQRAPSPPAAPAGPAPPGRS